MTGSITFFPVILFMLIFLWTPPHFWALALVKSEDYKKAGIPMMPNVVGQTATKSQILLYSTLVLICSIAPFFLGYVGYIYFVSALFMSSIFLSFSLALIMLPEKKLEMPLFGYSIFYLFGIFIFLMVDKYISGF